MSLASILGYGASAAAGASSASVQRKLRKKSKNPREPRVFSQATILTPVGLVGSLVFVPTFIVLTSEYIAGKGQGIAQVIGPAFPMIVSLMMFTHGLWRRFGVDENKVWTRFGKVFYREVKFSELTRLETGVERLILYAGKIRVNIDYNRFDYTLVYYGLLHELQRRKFILPDKLQPDSPAWDERAASWRRLLVKMIVQNHVEFFEQYPEERDYLNSLTEPPAKYEN